MGKANRGKGHVSFHATISDKDKDYICCECSVYQYNHRNLTYVGSNLKGSVLVS